MITVATTVPVVLERSVMRGQPPIETSPRPSATGSRHAVVDVLDRDAFVVVVVVVVAVPELDPARVVLLTHCNLPPVRLQMSVPVLVVCVCPALAHLLPAEAALVVVALANVTAVHVAATARAASVRPNLFGCADMTSNLLSQRVPSAPRAGWSSLQFGETTWAEGA